MIRPLLLANFPNVVGGGEIGLQMLATGLREHGHAPIVAIPGAGELADKIPDSHVIGSELAQAALDVRGLASDCDLVHATSLRSVLVAILANTNKPIVFHALIPNRDPMDPVIAPLVSQIVCNSQATRQRFFPFARTTLLYNGVAEHRPAPASLGLDMTRRAVLLAGPTSPRKGQADALPALESVLDARDDVDLVFAGPVFGSVGLTLRRAADRWRGRIRLLGYVPNLSGHLHEFALVLVPSRSEGFGRIAVEALRAGVPVLATRIEGLQEALTDHADPWLPDQRERWAERILAELERPTHSADELRAAADRFAPARFIDGVLSVYRDVVDKRSAPQSPAAGDTAASNSTSKTGGSHKAKQRYNLTTGREPIVASLASIPARRPQLAKVVESLLPQLDRLNVYLNGYDDTPSFLDQPRIVVARSQDHGDRGDAGKFFWSESIEGYHFTCDDDLHYPVDYVASMINAIERHERQAVVSVHGVIIKPAFTAGDDMLTRKVINFSQPLANDTPVHIVGTGVMAYHTSTLVIAPGSFGSPNLADIWLGVLAQKEHVPMVTVARLAEWVRQLEGSPEGIFEHSRDRRRTPMDTSKTRTELILQQMPWRLHISSTLASASMADGTNRSQ